MKTFFAIMLLCLAGQYSNAQHAKDSFYYKKVKESGVRFIPVYNGKYKVFTQRLGAGKIKLLLLHGGPVNTHEYFENFPQHLANKGIEIYYYDQLGSYYSDQPGDSTIWNVDRFVDEVEEVRKGLGLQEFYILGHSWGAFLGQLYAARYPVHLKGLILSNAPVEIRNRAKRNVSIESWRKDMQEKIFTVVPFNNLDTLVLDSIRNGIALKDPVQYSTLKKIFEQKRDSVQTRDYMYRLPGDLPEPMRRNMLHIDRVTQGAFMTKIFQPDYAAADEKIKCPVFILGGAHDRWFPRLYEDMKKQFVQTSVKIYLCPEGSHFAMWDDKENYFRELTAFLQEVEGKK